MDEQALQQLAAQLRQPTGEAGVQTGEWMNRGNVQMNMDTLAIVAATAGDSILEIGMGNGFFVKDILQQHDSIQYTGADFSEVMIAEATKINAEWIKKGQAKFVLTDAATLPFDDATFNKTFTVNTIYFWEDVIKTLTEIKRVLQPGGRLIIGLRPRQLMQQYPFTKYGFNMYSKEEVAALLSQNGFTILRAIENREPDFELKGELVAMENLVIEAVKD